MKIQSNFKDAYDKLQYLGVDESILYIRKTETKEAEPFPSAYRTRFYLSPDYKSSISRSCFVVLGNVVYPIVKFSIYKDLAWHVKAQLFSADGIDEFLAVAKPYLFKSWKEFEKNKKFSELRTKLKRFFQETKVRPDCLLTDEFVSVPVLTFTAKYAYTRTVTLNPKLTTIDGFYGHVPPHQVYQEIFRYLSGIANPEPPMITTSDESRLEAQGHDKLISFRTGTKQPKRRKHRIK